MIWLIILCGGMLTFAFRLSFILLLEKIEMPPWLEHALPYMPMAVFSAIIFPMVFTTDGQLNLSLSNPRLISGMLAGLVALRTKSILLTILAGMAVLFLMQSLYY